MKLISSLFVTNVIGLVSGFHSLASTPRPLLALCAGNTFNGNDDSSSPGAPLVDRRSIINMGSAVAASLSFPKVSNAMSSKNRIDGYAVQHTDREWAYILSGQQYNILRQGGTERPNSSILEGEERVGEYRCAGCATPLFASASKFHSGTGWPSFATTLAGVETENVNPVQASLLGAEVRCGTCGGHLGDVFGDGILYVNTPAFLSGKRYCIDGAGLNFKPRDGEDVFGDLPPPKKKSATPDFLATPKINARER
jgi:peptide-methionine (R)-S-oxide reductase|eukprot:scaffold2456_cov255-Chaetoceros_neogracile.AAC.9